MASGYKVLSLAVYHNHSEKKIFCVSKTERIRKDFVKLVQKTWFSDLCHVLLEITALNSCITAAQGTPALNA